MNIPSKPLISQQLRGDIYSLLLITISYLPMQHHILIDYQWFTA